MSIRSLAEQVRQIAEASRPSRPSKKITKSMRAKINQRLIEKGCDGNTRFKNIGMALGVISDVLGEFGIEPDAVFSADRFRGDSGSPMFSLAFTNTEDPFSPYPIDNTDLVIQWHRFETGKFEIISYLS